LKQHFLSGLGLLGVAFLAWGLVLTMIGSSVDAVVDAAAPVAGVMPAMTVDGLDGSSREM